MPWQLIYTSAPLTLVPGQSGFGFVARSASLRPGLAQKIEQMSAYPRTEMSPQAPLFRCRILRWQMKTYYVLSRLEDCGLDFSHRSNHIAHHLLFRSDELDALPTPAFILLRWPGWVRHWSGEPQVWADEDWNSLRSLNLEEASSPDAPRGWAGRAACFLESPRAIQLPPGHEERFVERVAESLRLVRSESRGKAWELPFTSFLEAEENPAEYRWCGCRDGAPAHTRLLARGEHVVRLEAIPERPAVDAESQRETAGATSDHGDVASSRETPVRDEPGSMKPVHLPPPPRERYGRNPGANRAARWIALGVAAALLSGLFLVMLRWPTGPRREQPGATRRENTPAPAATSHVPPLVHSRQESSLESEEVVRKKRSDVELDAALAGLLGHWPLQIVWPVSAQAYRIPGFANLGSFLNRMLADSSPLKSSQVMSAMHPGRWAASGNDANAGFKADLVAKRAWVQGSAGSVQIDFAGWQGNAGERIAARLERQTHTSWVVAVWPAAADLFPGFQVLFADPANPPPPIALDKEFLKMDGEVAALHPVLVRRLSRVRDGEGFPLLHLELWVGSESGGSSPLFELLQEPEPAPSRQVHLRAMRQRLESRAELFEAEARAHRTEAERLGAGEPAEPDRQMGLFLRLKASDPLAAFAPESAGGGSVAVAYLEYLAAAAAAANEALTGRFGPELAAAAQGSAAAGPALEALGKRVAESEWGRSTGFPEDHFILRWRSYVRRDAATARERASAVAERNGVGARRKRSLVPSSAEEVTEARLYLMRGGERIEFMRFAEGVPLK